MAEPVSTGVGGLAAGPPSRASKRASRTRGRLLKAALEMFSQKGVDATTIEEITELADVGKGTFYRHFGTKEDALIALVDDVVDRLVGRLRAAAGATQDLQQVVDRLLMAHWEFFVSSHAEFLLLFQTRLLLKLQRELADDLEPPYARYLGEIEAQLARCAREPIGRTKVRRLAYATAGFVSGFYSFAMIGLAPEEIERSLQPLRKAFVAASLAFLAGGPSAPEPQPAAAEAAGPARGGC